MLSAQPAPSLSRPLLLRLSVVIRTDCLICAQSIYHPAQVTERIYTYCGVKGADTRVYRAVPESHYIIIHDGHAAATCGLWIDLEDAVNKLKRIINDRS